MSILAWDWDEGRERELKESWVSEAEWAVVLTSLSGQSRLHWRTFMFQNGFVMQIASSFPATTWMERLLLSAYLSSQTESFYVLCCLLLDHKQAYNCSNIPVKLDWLNRLQHNTCSDAWQTKALVGVYIFRCRNIMFLVWKVLVILNQHTPYSAIDGQFV